MVIAWNGIKYVMVIALILILVFVSSVFGVLLYAKLSGKEWILYPGGESAYVQPRADIKPAVEEISPSSPKKRSHLLDAPIIRQFPELPAGCEITSLAMLLQYAGINKSKLDLVPEMKKDDTSIVWGSNGSIAFWGHPNNGFVGDITGKSKAFGIYHEALFELLQTYIPTSMDMTNMEFEEVERQISAGYPVIAWTTINFQIPQKWVTWDSPNGVIETTFMEHAVLLVGYDEQFVYVNDPWTGKKNVKIDKKQFIDSWKVMGKQALSYTNTDKDSKK